MKCNVKTSYIELTVPQFIFMYPVFSKMLRSSNPELFQELLSDPDYIVRVSSDNEIEFGYKEDHWIIGA